MVDRKAVIDYDKCTVCGACVPICRKFEAIVMHEAHGDIRTSEGDVWVFCETEDGCLTSVACELLGTARELADTLGVPAAGVLIGADVAGLAQDVIAHGADRVYVAQDTGLARFSDEPFAAVLARLIGEHQPEILLGGATAIGRALLPRVAVLIQTGLTADCTELGIDPATGLLLQTRPAFGGNILATITCESYRPQMATVRPAVLRRPDPDPTRTGTVVPCDVRKADLANSIEWLQFTPKGQGDVDLHQAEIIVSAGYGTGGPEGVALVADLAKALGASLGASRAAVDAGWVEYPHQVGQTGTTVQPKLYIACGISGAIQHLVGMQSSDTIVAINRDPEAPIFDHADFAVVGDLFDVVPELIRQIEKARSGEA